MKFILLVSTLFLACSGIARADVYYDHRTLWISGGSFNSCALPRRCDSTDTSFESVSQYRLSELLQKHYSGVHEPSLRSQVQSLRNEVNDIKAQLERPAGLEVTTALEKNLAKKQKELRKAEGTLENVVFFWDRLTRDGSFEIDSSSSEASDGMSLGMVAGKFVGVFGAMKDEKKKAEQEATKNEKKEWEERKKREHRDYALYGGCRASCRYERLYELYLTNGITSHKYDTEYRNEVVEIIRSGSRYEAERKLREGCKDSCKFNGGVVRYCSLDELSIRCN